MERRNAQAEDLLELVREEVAEIRKMARRGQEAIRNGHASSGATALRRIEERALDAERVARGEIQARCFA